MPGNSPSGAVRGWTVAGLNTGENATGDKDGECLNIPPLVALNQLGLDRPHHREPTSQLPARRFARTEQRNGLRRTINGIASPGTTKIVREHPVIGPVCPWTGQICKGREGFCRLELETSQFLPRFFSRRPSVNLGAHGSRQSLCR